MLLRRHRSVPDVDPAFALKPAETLDETFSPQGEAAAEVAPDAPEAPAEELKGEALDEALRERGLSLSGKVDEKRARLKAHDESVL